MEEGHFRPTWGSKTPEPIGVRTFRPTDISPHGHFAPWKDISPHGRFAPWTSRPTGVSSVRVVNEKERRAPKARESRGRTRRRRRRGRAPQARGLRRCRRRGGGVWGGGVPSPPGQGAGEWAVPPPQNFFFDFGSQYAPGTPAGARPPDPHYRLALPRSPWLCL